MAKKIFSHYITCRSTSRNELCIAFAWDGTAEHPRRSEAGRQHSTVGRLTPAVALHVTVGGGPALDGTGSPADVTTNAVHLHRCGIDGTVSPADVTTNAVGLGPSTITAEHYSGACGGGRGAIPPDS